MVLCGSMMFIIFVLSVNWCSSHGMEHKDRRMPPPVMSLLDKLRSFKTQESARIVRDVGDEHLSKDNDLTEFTPQKQTDNSMDSFHIPLSSQLHQRQKRYISSISMRGCHLGTCQVQNLASMLYRLGNNSFKDGSNKDTKDPLGYGRRRRSLVQNPKITDILQKLLAT
ncbi:ADM-like [Pelobates cultripes]|uniref:ADM-like n=1 Tax=Pelobates cultripes TaxID=61616 RepID=A0AAD1WLA5_PELCU|nr:ADM-like [Pelobates cultripes]